jgi:hypothetical protein
MKPKTQGQRILEALRQNPEGVSVRYMKRELMISETNGRISELRGRGYDIRPVGTDEFGFSVQKLFAEPRSDARFEEKNGVRTAVLF